MYLGTKPKPPFSASNDTGNLLRFSRCSLRIALISVPQNMLWLLAENEQKAQHMY